MKPRFYFDLACPFSYLAAERIERVLGEVEWIPTASVAFRQPGWAKRAAVRAHAETCAAALRLPLVWPDPVSDEVPGALRAAAYAAENGAGSRFALAASRLAFCGGFDLEDPEILAEAAAAAGVSLGACLAAAREQERDDDLLATAHGLRVRGVDSLPAVAIGRYLFNGESAIAQGAALLRGWSAFEPPLAPAG
jgi:2-hydroxychromene-2-carboxylate isomerase